jgi:predicted GH43/DUF377 family glycosyl hydrolase
LPDASPFTAKMHQETSLPPEADEPVPVHRSGIHLRPDNSRVLLRPFLPGGEERAREIIGRILASSKTDMAGGLRNVIKQFSHDHLDVGTLFTKRCAELRHLLPPGTELSPMQSLVIGAYFTSEYSLQSAALFNPSIVPHPSQESVPPGALRFVMSLRATGEGHISSIEFREGIISADGTIAYDPVSRSVTTPSIKYPRKRKDDLVATLGDLEFDRHFIDAAFSSLDDEFSMGDLTEILRHPEHWGCAVGKSPFECEHEQKSVIDAILWAAQGDYLVEFSGSLALSERVVFPATPSEKGGIEDARFVLFHEDDGGHRYYATYTAFDGTNILPQLIETENFLRFRLRPLHGPAARDKGMALFPRKIGGKYVMLGRQGGVNVSIMFSDSIHRWSEHETLLEPREPWEYIQMGNCGSPLETEAGWLVLTHGVGAVRNYCIGAVLLDLDDPRKVIGRLRNPLLEPLEHERDGYVPNVVYSCGSVIHNGWLVLPYAVSDYATTNAVIRLDDLLERLTR